MDNNKSISCGYSQDQKTDKWNSTLPTPPIKPAGYTEHTLKLREVDEIINKTFLSRQRLRYNLIFDRNGGCEPFYRYKEALINVGSLMLGIALGRETRADVIETLRMTLVGCMKTGKNMVLYLGRVPVDFLSELDGGPGNLPWGTIFQFEKWRREENFKSIVRPYENVDAFGNKGAYYMQDLFTISILMDIDDEEEEEN